MSYSYKQWSADQTADNVIHASDLERWQDGITDAGGTWSGSWTDEKDTLTADQLNALETEIASLYGTGFTAKTWEDGQVPGVDEWNRIEDAINTILSRTAFAIYCETDNSLTFYADVEVPSEGDTYKNKAVTAVYEGFNNTRYTSASAVPWYDVMADIKTAVFDSSYKPMKPTAVAYWFNGATSLTAVSNAANLDTSSATSMQAMFYGCSALTSLDTSTWETGACTNFNLTFRECGFTTIDVSHWDVSKATTLAYMFYNCQNLTTLDTSKWVPSSATNLEYMFGSCVSLAALDVSAWNTSAVTNMGYMFNTCSSLTTLDLSSFDTSRVTNMQYMFSGCSKITVLDLSGWDTSNVTNMQRSIRNMTALTTVYVSDGQFNTDKVTNDTNMFEGSTSLVGGNGTKYDSSKVDSSMAHIDTADNPGYFTAKG